MERCGPRVAHPGRRHAGIVLLRFVALAGLGGCGSTGGSGTGGRGGNSSGGTAGRGTGGIGGGGSGRIRAGASGAGGACGICDDPNADVAGCPADVGGGVSCTARVVMRAPGTGSAIAATLLAFRWASAAPAVALAERRDAGGPEVRGRWRSRRPDGRGPRCRRDLPGRTDRVCT
jgi:hypothetical protein